MYTDKYLIYNNMFKIILFYVEKLNFIFKKKNY